MSMKKTSSPEASGFRWMILPVMGLLLTAVLFLALGWIIRAPQYESLTEQAVVQNIKLAKIEPKSEKPPDPKQILDNSPPPPPSAPPALGRPDLPALKIPALVLQSVEVANISIPVVLGDTGMSLGSAGKFSGFGRGGAGTGSGTGDSGSGGGWKGKPLVPLSTARPQMPDWACDQKLNGWVEALFNVLPNGRVQDVRILDANPRGVFEAAVIESISNWIYAPTGKTAEVKQRVEMKHEECAYNW